MLLIAEENKMPCYPCNNGQYKFGKDGKCNLTKQKCREIEKAYYANKGKK